MTPEVIEAVARERCCWERLRPDEQGAVMEQVTETIAALTAAGYEVRPAASGPVMPEEPSEAVLSAMVLTKHGWAWVRPEPQADIYTAIRAALIAEQAGHEETTNA